MSVPEHESPATWYGLPADKFFESSLRPRQGQHSSVTFAISVAVNATMCPRSVPAFNNNRLDLTMKEERFSLRPSYVESLSDARTNPIGSFSDLLSIIAAWGQICHIYQ